jgi:hypothetical protein
MDADCLWTGCGRGLDTASANRPVYGADIPRPNLDHFADAESFAGEGVKLVRVKSLRLKAAKGDKCAMSKGDKLQQIRCRILSQFDTGADATGFVGRLAKGLVSFVFRLRMRARQPREIRFDGMSADLLLTSWRIRVEAVCVNQTHDDIAPVPRHFAPDCLCDFKFRCLCYSLDE